MINQKEITVEWLSEVSKKHRNVDKILTEKTIRALLLLEGLAKQNIDFVFKGLCIATHKPLNDILGDKLTAFAPNTTGIPYYKHGDSMSMEIIKQLYDIGNLVDVVADIETIKDTFHKFAETEITYRNENQTPKEVLNDIYQTALSIVTRGTDGNGNFDDLQKGIQRIKNLIFSESYQIEKAIIHASKAAYMATLIKHNASSFDKFEHLQQLTDWIISEPFNTKLNKLKKSNPEAFFYWYKIYEFEKKQYVPEYFRNYF